YLDALELQLAALPHQYEGYLATSSDLTGFYSRAGDWARVVQIWSRILPPVREFAGVAHPLYAEALNNLANGYFHLDRYEEAERFCLQALDIRGCVPGEEHEDYAQSLYNAGFLYKNTGDQT